MDEGGGGSTCPRLSMRKTLELFLWTWFYCHHNHRQLWNVIRHKKHYKQKGCRYGGVYKPTLPYSLYLYYLFNKTCSKYVLTVIINHTGIFNTGITTIISMTDFFNMTDETKRNKFRYSGVWVFKYNSYNIRSSPKWISFLWK